MTTDEIVETWQWPGVGPSPVSYGMDTEIFDSEKFPHVQTFVREAIQNSLDARREKAAPVRVKFQFGNGSSAFARSIIGDLQAKKAACGLSWPEGWPSDVSWLLVEDANSSGLTGDLGKRSSDFWNYWLNFGISNKNGSGRGGRGIGRVTFLIASGISTVIGLTRRGEDGVTAACGMSVLKPGEHAGKFRSSYAYLARAERNDIYDLYEDDQFISGLIQTFGTADYRLPEASGLSLIIPYPHESLRPEALIAAAIEHFAPAIITGALVVEVDGAAIDHSTIDAQASRVRQSFPAGPFSDDPARVLNLIRASLGTPDRTLRIDNISGRLSDCLEGAELEQIRSTFESTGKQIFLAEVPVVRRGRRSLSPVKVAISRAPKNAKPADLFFREGMCLPEVTARYPADIEVVIQCNEGELVTYLNFCEGKAHLGLIENKEVAAKLVEHGFHGYLLRRFMRRMPEELRALVLPDATKPDATIFSGFFSVPKSGKREPENGRKKPDPSITPPAPPAPPPPAKPRVFLIDELPDGFRVRSNPQYTQWPMNVSVEVAYADGSRRPAWSRHDFQLPSMTCVHSGSIRPEFARNKLVCRDCGPDFSIEFTGFDGRRELVTNVRPFRNA